METPAWAWLDRPFTLRELSKRIPRILLGIVFLASFLIGFLFLFALALEASLIAKTYVAVADFRWARDGVLLSDFRADHETCRTLADYEPSGSLNAMNRGFTWFGTYYEHEARFTAYANCMEAKGYRKSQYKR